MEVSNGQIASMAIGIEEQGYRFYTEVAKKFTDAKVRQMFERFAEEEQEHIRTFQYIFDKLGIEAAQIEKERGAYFKAILSVNVFPINLNNTLDETVIKSPIDALNVAVQAEKDAILFYQELFEQIKAPELKAMVSELLREEKMHLIELRNNIYELTNK